MDGTVNITTLTCHDYGAIIAGVFASHTPPGGTIFLKTVLQQIDVSILERTGRRTNVGVPRQVYDASGVTCHDACEIVANQTDATGQSICDYVGKLNFVVVASMPSPIDIPTVRANMMIDLAHLGVNASIYSGNVGKSVVQAYAENEMSSGVAFVHDNLTIVPTDGLIYDRRRLSTLPDYCDTERADLFPGAVLSGGGASGIGPATTSCACTDSVSFEADGASLTCSGDVANRVSEPGTTCASLDAEYGVTVANKCPVTCGVCPDSAPYPEADKHCTFTLLGSVLLANYSYSPAPAAGDLVTSGHLVRVLNTVASVPGAATTISAVRNELLFHGYISCSSVAPAPPPLPPLAPEEMTVATTATKFEMLLVAAGDVASFDATAVALLRNRLRIALACFLPACDVRLTVSAASVAIDAEIVVFNETQTSTVQSNLDTLASQSTNETSTELGVVVAQAPAVSSAETVNATQVTFDPCGTCASVLSSDGVQVPLSFYGPCAQGDPILTTSSPPPAPQLVTECYAPGVSGWEVGFFFTCYASDGTSCLAVAAPNPPPPPVASPPPAGATAVQDPHIVFAHGGKADFRGRDHTVYNMLSAPRVSFGLMTENATFIKPGYKPKLVHGSFFTNAFWTLRTKLTRTVLHVNTSAVAPGFDVWYSNGTAAAHRPGVWKEYKKEDVRVFYKQATLFLRAAGFETNVTRKPVYNHLMGPKWRFDMSVRKLDGTGFERKHGVSSKTVAPHGIVGQSWDDDDLAVDGKQDDYEAGGTEVWTTAMAEGAIEGDADDYALPTPFSPKFKFSRFDTTTPTPPRRVEALLGKRRASSGAQVASASDQLGIGYR